MAGHLWQFLLCLFFVCKRVALGGMREARARQISRKKSLSFIDYLFFQSIFLPPVWTFSCLTICTWDKGIKSVTIHICVLIVKVNLE